MVEVLHGGGAEPSSGAHGGWEGGPAATWRVLFFPYLPHE
jgi:hypothetical protein